MDPVNNLNQIMEVLRRQLAEKSQQTGRSSKSNKQADKQNANIEQLAKPPIESIKKRVGERINKLPPDERESKQAAQIFIESILVWEFGDELLQDPGFTDLTDEIRQVMTEDPDLWKKFRGLLGSL